MNEISSFEEYLKDQPEQTKVYLKQLREYILEAAPDADEKINYNIPAFSLIKGGKRDKQIMIAGYKKHVGFYPTPDVMDAFWDKLEGYKKAKGSVQFPLDQPLPKQLIIEMVEYRKQQLNNE